MTWFKSLVDRLSGQTPDPAEAARAAQLASFQARVARDLARTDIEPDALQALLRLPAELGLPDEEVELEIERVHGALDLMALRTATARDGLPIVEHQHKAVGTDRCHFRASASLANDGADRTGRLFLTERRLVFVTSPMIALSWGAIGTIEQDERDLIVTPVTRTTIYQFRCNSFSEAQCGAFIAQLLKQPRGNSATAAGDPPSPR